MSLYFIGYMKRKPLESIFANISFGFSAQFSDSKVWDYSGSKLL